MGNAKGVKAASGPLPDVPEGFWWRESPYGNDWTLLHSRDPVCSVTYDQTSPKARKKKRWCASYFGDKGMPQGKFDTREEAVAFVEGGKPQFLDRKERYRLSPPPRTDCHTHVARPAPPRDASGNEG